MTTREASDVDTGPSAASRGSRDAISAAAERLFAERGYTAASVRDIAKAAGVNPALVIRYFGSKEELFLKTMRFEDGFRELLNGPIEAIGRSIVRRLLRNERETARRAYYTAMLRAGEMEEVRGYVVRTNTATIVEPLVNRLTGPDVETRAALVSAQIAGLLNLLWMLEAPELVAAPDEAIIEHYGRAIQTLVDP